jgi:hypothetical protein
MTEANQSIDAMLKDPKKSKDAEVWYYKGAVALACSKTAELKGELAYQHLVESFGAYKTCQVLDKSDKLMKLEMYESYYSLYAGSYNLGVTEYNKKNLPVSMHAFMLTVDINDYIQSKEYTFNGIQLAKLDTSLLINIVVTALQSDSMQIAYQYYRKLADANIRTKEVRDVTEDMLSNQLKKGDDAIMTSLLGYAAQLFPEEEVWLEYELKFYENKRDKAIFYRKYEELINTHPNNFTLPYNYAVELYNDMHVGENSKALSDSMHSKFMDIIQKAIASEGNKDMLGRFLLDRHLFNEYNDKQRALTAIKGNKPQDLSAKNQLKGEIEKIRNLFVSNSESIVGIMEAITKKAPIQKANYKLVLQMLTEIYADMKNTQKVSFYEKKTAELDKEP